MKTLRFLIVAAAALAAPAFAQLRPGHLTATAAAMNLWVAKGGSNNNSCLFANQACATPTGAVAKLPDFIFHAVTINVIGPTVFTDSPIIHDKFIGMGGSITFTTVTSATITGTVNLVNVQGPVGFVGMSPTVQSTLTPPSGTPVYPSGISITSGDGSQVHLSFCFGGFSFFCIAADDGGFAHLDISNGDLFVGRNGGGGGITFNDDSSAFGWPSTGGAIAHESGGSLSTTYLKTVAGWKIMGGVDAGAVLVQGRNALTNHSATKMSRECNVATLSGGTKAITFDVPFNATVIGCSCNDTTTATNGCAATTLGSTGVTFTGNSTDHIYYCCDGPQ